ncbi:hypothetical protein HMPREF1214_02646 [Bacteroides sp. HPS0048]|nr:hypothetical protein HMPREF1214_02646 [Bacteroides sp. HPS0048]
MRFLKSKNKKNNTIPKIIWLIIAIFVSVTSGKSSVRCPLKPKRFYPLKIFNNAPSKSLDRWGYYYFSLFPSVCRHLPDTFSV